MGLTGFKIFPNKGEKGRKAKINQNRKSAKERRKEGRERGRKGHSHAKK